MKRITVLYFLLLSVALLSTSCDKKTEKSVVVTKVQGYKPNLPPVPQIPPPSAPETYPDGSYSVYGVRKNVSKTINTPVEITAYIVKIYQKPECPEGQTCYTMMPHLYLADDPKETLAKREIRLVGYAQSFKEMEDQKEMDESGKKEELPEGVVLPPVIWDWRLGHKYKIKAVFTRRSSAGFMDRDGLLEYNDHQCLDCPAEDEDSKKKK
jgi:hypothetical protein